MATEKTGVGIKLQGVYKIFGDNPKVHIDAVLKGMSKAELLEKHHHILGLNNVNIDMPAGGIQVIMGLSGSGKSTLIRHVNRLIEPTAGKVLADGVDVVGMDEDALRNYRRHSTAMVFQKFALLPHWNVLDNVGYGLRIQGVDKAEREKRSRRWIERVGLAGFEARFPNQLSGGMQQRVGLARALAIDAPILLMDEAFSALDPLIRVDMQSVLLDLQKEIRKTIVFITHDLDEALRLGDMVAILRDGVVVQQGTSQEIVRSPADDYIATFVREVNRGRVLKVEGFARPGATDGGPSIVEGTNLETAARLMSEAGATAATVVDASGRPFGVITLAEVVAGMVSPGPHA